MFDSVSFERWLHSMSIFISAYFKLPCVKIKDLKILFIFSKVKLMKPEEKNRSGANSENSKGNENAPGFSAWRYGPASLWYDMLNVPENGEGFDYGFRLKEVYIMRLFS